MVEHRQCVDVRPQICGREGCVWAELDCEFALQDFPLLLWHLALTFDFLTAVCFALALRVPSFCLARLRGSLQMVLHRRIAVDT